MNKIKSFAELDHSVFSFEHSEPPSEKPSQKSLDIFTRSLLEQNPELRGSIASTLQLLNQRQSKLPVIHITSGSVRKDGKVVTTGFFENIKQKGFQARHTNVGAFVEKGKTTQRAEAQYFIAHPEEFVKSFYLLLQRYAHHRSRTNKEALGDNKNAEEGIPEMVIIDGNLSLEKGSDYDDHFILAQGATPDKLIGQINLEAYKPYKEHLKELLEEFLHKIEERYGNQKMTV